MTCSQSRDVLLIVTSLLTAWALLAIFEFVPHLPWWLDAIWTGLIFCQLFWIIQDKIKRLETRIQELERQIRS